MVLLLKNSAFCAEFFVRKYFMSEQLDCPKRLQNKKTACFHKPLFTGAVEGT
jgi:hypothetical protein